MFCDVLLHTILQKSMWYLFSFTAPLSEGARSHLLRVYALLTAGVISASLGCYADMHYWHYGSLTTALIGAFLFGLARSSVTESAKDNTTGVLLFLLACGLEGLSLSPLVHTAYMYYPAALTTAFLSTIAVFASFSVAAIVAKRREFFFLAGLLGTAASIMAILSLTNMVIRSQTILDIQIYGGLAMFIGYILLDTQVMIERYENGNFHSRTNFVRPACDLFGDLVGVFVRILIILMKKAEKRNGRRQSFGSPERRFYKRSD